MSSDAADAVAYAVGARTGKTAVGTKATFKAAIMLTPGLDVVAVGLEEAHQHTCKVRVVVVLRTAAGGTAIETAVAAVKGVCPAGIEVTFAWGVQ